jgi:DNA recombination protein RmuC
MPKDGSLMLLLVAFLAAVVGFAGAFFLSKSRVDGLVKASEDRLNDVKSNLDRATAERAAIQARLNEVLPLEGEVSTLRESVATVRNTLTSLEAEIEALRQANEQSNLEIQGFELKSQSQEALIREREDALERQRKQFAEDKTQLENSFASLSKQALAQAQQSFLEVAESKFKDARQVSQKEIDQLLSPMKETLGQLKEHTRELEEKRTHSYAELSQQVRSLLSSTNQLSNALRRPEVRGSWGEITLKRAAEAAGLVEGNDFEMQVSSNTDDGRLRPDMVVRLPNGKTIVVDSKVPLDAYLAAIHSEDATEKGAKLKEHAAQVRKHIQQLSSKQYQGIFADSADFVVMFVPSEALYQGAIEQDPSLLEEAFNKKVILANPMTLVALLRTVASGMQQQKAYENALQIAKLGGELHDAVGVMTEHFVKVGKNIGQAANSYNQMVGSVERNVLSKARKMRELGAKGTKELDEPEILNAVIRPSALPGNPGKEEPEALF